MPWSLPEVSIRIILEDGMRRLRLNKPAFVDIFADYTHDELDTQFGASYVEEIWTWFSTTKIPVIQSWNFNVQRIPCITVHLASEQEGEDKLALNDYAGAFSQTETTGTAAFTVMLDLGLHASKGGDHVLWLYYILSYMLFKLKPELERLGLKMGTFSASDYTRDAEKAGNNVWTRWVRYRCTTQNFWGQDALTAVTEVRTTAQTDLTTTDISATPDVDTSTIDLTASTGLVLSRSGTDDDDLGF